MLRTALLSVMAALPLAAQSGLWAAGSLANNYVVGAKLPASGLFHRHAGGAWEHVGFNLPVFSTIDFHGDAVYLAGGNGLIRIEGGRWRILTGSDVTELRDVFVCPDGALWFAHTLGIRVSRDRGQTWTEVAATKPHRFTEAVRIAGYGAILAGGDDGVWRSVDQGASWQLAGASGFQVLRVEVSPHDRCHALAATQGGGLFASRDCGKSFEDVARIGVDHNLYAIAFDPANRARIAVGGFGVGVLLSNDGGRTFAARFDNRNVTAVAFAGERIYAAVSDDGLYTSADAGVSWQRAGMENSRISCLRAAPEVKP